MAASASSRGNGFGDTRPAIHAAPAARQPAALGDAGHAGPRRRAADGDHCALNRRIMSARDAPLDAVTLRSLLVCAATLGLAGCTRGCDRAAGPACERTEQVRRPRPVSPRLLLEPRVRRVRPPLPRRAGVPRTGQMRRAEGAQLPRREPQPRVRRRRRDGLPGGGELCAGNSLCSLYDGWCIAETTEDCAASRRCRTHECGAPSATSACGAGRKSCPPLAAPADAPTWARPGPHRLRHADARPVAAGRGRVGDPRVSGAARPPRRQPGADRPALHGWAVLRARRQRRDLRTRRHAPGPG